MLDEINGVSSLIKYFVMLYQNENLKDLSILDTPGFNSNDSEDTERTIEVINECDALFWVIDVNLGTINKSSIELIKKHLRKPLYIVINKVDTKATSEINQVEQHIRKTLQEKGIQIQDIIRFSAKAPLKDIMDPIHSVPQDNDVNLYVSQLTEYVVILTKICNDNVKELKKELDDNDKEYSELVDRYNESLEKLESNCLDALDIPQYKEHFWSSNRYEMSEDEGGKLGDLLVEICRDRRNEIVDLFNQIQDTLLVGQKIRSHYNDENAKWQEITYCKKQLEKQIKNLEK